MQQNSLLSSGHVNGENIRREWHNGEWYFSVIDLVAELLEVERKRAQSYWYTLKHRLKAEGSEIPAKCLAIKFRAADGKMRLTDASNRDVWEEITAIIQRVAFNTFKRVAHQKDEVINLHPLVITYLEASGGMVEHHVTLLSGKEIDLIARFEEKTLIIEAKSVLTGGQFFHAIGQVLCYVAEYGNGAQPAIACLAGKADQYAYDSCRALGIQLIEVQPNGG